MNKNAGIIGVETVEEHEDGGATYTFQMDAHARGLLAEEGLKCALLYSSQDGHTVGL